MYWLTIFMLPFANTGCEALSAVTSLTSPFAPRVNWIKALPSSKLYARVKFASDAQAVAAKAKIAAGWPNI